MNMIVNNIEMGVILHRATSTIQLFPKVYEKSRMVLLSTISDEVYRKHVPITAPSSTSYHMCGVQRSKPLMSCTSPSDAQSSLMSLQKRLCSTGNHNNNNNNKNNDNGDNNKESDKKEEVVVVKDATNITDGLTSSNAIPNTHSSVNNINTSTASEPLPSPATPADSSESKENATNTRNTNNNTAVAEDSKPSLDSRKSNGGIVRGFERFFQREFMSEHPPSSWSGNASVEQSRAAAFVLSPEETRILNDARKKNLDYKRNRRIVFVCFIIGLYSGYKICRMWAMYSADLNQVEYVSVKMNPISHFAHMYDASGNMVSVTNFIDAKAFHAKMTEEGKSVSIHVPTYFPTIPLLILCLLPFMALLNSSFSSGAKMVGKMSAKGAPGKSRFRFKKEIGLTTRLADVAGMTEAKQEVNEIIDFIANPSRYTALGAKLPKGVLLDGPPGVGKTLLAKAVAGEAMVNFVSCSGSEFEEVYVGVGAQRVRELFKEARAASPCVVFIDEIDAFGRKRSSDKGGNSRGTLNAFLSELDGFKEAKGIIVLAATNRADVLDGALTRSGRFDRKITIDLPPYNDRIAIAKVHLKPLKLDTSVGIDSFAESIASLTPGCSGADIFNICNEAAIIASRENHNFVTLKYFQKAIDRVLLGLEKRSKTINNHEKTRLAYHEAGHVVLSWYQRHTDPVIKTSIAPRGTHIGHTQKLPHDVFISTQERLREQMVARLGGFVAEEYFFSDLSSEAAEDLKAVTDKARDEICVYGMHPDIGNFGYVLNSDAIMKPYGPKRENAIDIAVSSVVQTCAITARAMVAEHTEKIQLVAGSLLKKETLTAQELWLLLGDRPVMSSEFRRYLEC